MLCLLLLESPGRGDDNKNEDQAMNPRIGFLVLKSYVFKDYTSKKALPHGYKNYRKENK